MSALAAVRTATDADIHALYMAAAYDGMYAEFTRDRVGGSTIRATKSAILAASGRMDCCLCARPMLSIDPEGRDMPEVNHLVPEIDFNGGGWLMRASVLRMVGFAPMIVACRGCNVDNGDKIIWPSTLLHSDHFVTGCAPKPDKSTSGDTYTRDRRERIGW